MSQRYGFTFQYQNEYGELELSPVTEPMSVHDAKRPDDAAVRFDAETAEKIALITDNRRIQLVVPRYDPEQKRYEPNGWWIFLHDSTSTGVIARIEKLNYRGPANPQAEIERVARLYRPPMRL